MASPQESFDIQKERKKIFQSNKIDVMMAINFIVKTGKILRKKGKNKDFQHLADRSIKILEGNFYHQKTLLLLFVTLAHEEDPIGADMLKYCIEVEKYLDDSLLSDKIVKMGILKKIGDLYLTSGDYMKTLDFVSRAMTVAHNLKIESTEASCCISLGKGYLGLKDFKKAIGYFQKGLEIFTAVGDVSGIMRTCCNLGNAYLDAQEYEKAVGILQKGLENESTGNESDVASINCNLGNAYRNLGKYEEAIKCYQNGLEITTTIGDLSGIANNKGNLGNAYTCLGKHEEAIRCYMEALEISTSTGDQSALVKDNCNLGSVYLSLGENKKAIQHFEEGLKISSAIGNQLGTATINGNLGNVYLNLGQYKDAIECYQMSLKTNTAMRNRSGIASNCTNLGATYLSLGEYEKAIEYCQKALEITSAIGDQLGIATCNGSLGNVYLRLGEYKKAINLYKKGLEISTAIGDAPGIASKCGNLGNVYLYLGEYTKAIQYYQRGLEICEATGDRSGIATKQCNLGNAYLSLGKYEKAIACCTEGLTISTKIGDRSVMADCSANLGSAYLNLGLYEKAIKYCRKGLEINKEIGHKSAIIFNNGNLGDAYLSLKEYENAIHHYQESLKMSNDIREKSGIANSNGKLGNAYFTMGEYEKAIGYYQKGLEASTAMDDRSGIARTNANLGITYISLRKYEKAIDCFTHGLSISVEMCDPSLEGYCRGGIGYTYLLRGLCCADKQIATGLFEAATSYLTNSILCWDQIFSDLAIDQNKISLTNEYFDSYVLLMQCFTLLGRIEAAMLVIDLGKAKALHDFIEKEDESPKNDILHYTRKTWKIIGDNEEQMHVKGICTTLRSDIGTSSVLLFAFDRENFLNIWTINGQGETKAFKHSDQFSQEYIFNALETLFRESNLEVMLSRDASFQEVSAVSSHRCISQIVPLFQPDKKQVEERTTRTNPAELGNHENAATRNKTTLQLLFKLLVYPVKDMIQTGKLIIVPDKFLFFVPFCSLLDGNGCRLSENYCVQITPSLHTLVSGMTKSRDQSLGYALFVGNPDLRQIKFRGRIQKPLPHAKNEVELLAPLFEAKTLLEDEATKEKVLEFIHGASVLHIAAHGEPGRGEILLAPNANEMAQSSSVRETSYLLKQHDIQKINLKARLVVLSCCHTGQGKVSCEGVVGLTRAFLAAGARSVLATLWPIDDEATKQIMLHFYREVCNETSVCEALRRAMNIFQEQENEELRSFKFWAPFTIYGEDVKFSRNDVEEIKQKSRELSDLTN